MAKKRWYDHDPTLSMAVSLLHSASIENQLRATEYLFRLLEESGALNEQRPRETFTLSHLLPFGKRHQLEQSTWRLIEVMKHLPQPLQMEMALNLIHYVYQLDSGLEMTDSDHEMLQTQIQAS